MKGAGMHSTSRLIFLRNCILNLLETVTKENSLDFFKTTYRYREFFGLIFLDTGFSLFLALRHEDFSHWAAFEYGLSDWLRVFSRSFGSFAKNIGLLGQCRFSDAWQLYVHQISEQWFNRCVAAVTAAARAGGRSARRSSPRTRTRQTSTSKDR